MATHLKQIVSISGGDPVATLRVRCPIAALAAQPGGMAHLAAACADGCLRVWDSDTLQLVTGFRVRSAAEGLAFDLAEAARSFMCAAAAGCAGCLLSSVCLAVI